MNKATVIIGPQGSGKTTRARELAGQGATVWSELEFMHQVDLGFPALDPSAALVIEDVTTLAAIVEVKRLATCCKIRQHPKHKKTRLIEPPRTIVITTSRCGWSQSIEASRFFTFIETQAA